MNDFFLSTAKYDFDKEGGILSNTLIPWNCDLRLAETEDTFSSSSDVSSSSMLAEESI